MRSLLSRGDLVGREVVDVNDEQVGTIHDTWPADGGGEAEMVLLKMGRFARRRYVPVGELIDDTKMKLPWSRLEVDDAPDAEDKRWGDPGSVARAHWALVSD